LSPKPQGWPGGNTIGANVENVPSASTSCATEQSSEARDKLSADDWFAQHLSYMKPALPFVVSVRKNVQATPPSMKKIQSRYSIHPQWENQSRDYGPQAHGVPKAKVQFS